MNFFNLKREAFSMFTAIMVIVLMSSVSVLVMSVSGKIVKETTAQYRQEQAILLANSYTEYAVMAVTANDRSGTGCLSTINGLVGNIALGYDITVEIAYIGTADTIDNCEGTRKLSTGVTNNDTPLTIIVDAYVKYKDLENTNDTNDVPNIVYHRRTVQKI